MPTIKIGDKTVDADYGLFDRVQQIMTQAQVENPEEMAVAVFAAANDREYHQRMMAAVKSKAWPAILPPLVKQIKTASKEPAQPPVAEQPPAAPPAPRPMMPGPPQPQPVAMKGVSSAGMVPMQPGMPQNPMFGLMGR